MVSALAVLALLPSAALANVFLPSLADFGNAKVSIYAGNSQQQTSLQTISESVNVATTSSIQFTPDPKIGPNANEYFVRVESLALKDAASPQFPALAFLAKFTMAGMTGEFSDAVKAQIAGQATASYRRYGCCCF
ncbi:hypothetical protein DL96DRAFT_1578722 [Flagelloscypha sp. PMI_526]|nr:hypothetical protein DL96DRAFT_1578722 [Flagelloscypha sp. PMI_526]